MASILYLGFTSFHPDNDKYDRFGLEEGGPISNWPKPRKNQRLFLYVKKLQHDHVPALKEALERRDIDSVECTAKCLMNNDEARELFKQLIAQDRDWKINFLKSGLCSDETFLEVLPQVLPHLKMARQLELDVLWKDMLPVLRTFPHLQVLDITYDKMNSKRFFALYQEEEKLAPLIPHISLGWITLENTSSLPIQFPLLARRHLRSIGFELDSETYLAFPHWIRQIHQLENLRYLHLCFSQGFYDGEDGDDWESDSDEDDESDEYAEFHLPRKCDPDCIIQCLQALFDWICHPSCRLSHFFTEPAHIVSRHLSPEHSRMTLEAIGRNRSIQEISLEGLSTFQMDWSTDIFPFLSKSSVHHWVIPVWGMNKHENVILQWMLQMRPTRLMTIGWHVQWYSEEHRPQTLRYISVVHAGWRKWQQTAGANRSSQEGIRMAHDGPTTTTNSGASVVAAIPRWYWASELQRILLYSRKFNRPVLSLDATYFLLQHWLCNISDVPPPRRRYKKKRRRTVTLCSSTKRAAQCHDGKGIMFDDSHESMHGEESVVVA